MQYKYGLNQNYEDFASGRVLYSAPGVPNFPVRLIQEIYGRCLSYSKKKENIFLYDCCCGGGYSLTVLGLLNQDTLTRIVGSDIDHNILKTAENNLALLSSSGMNKRREELHELYESYHKEQHKEAGQSAERLMHLLINPIQTHIIQADAFHLEPLQGVPDIIITDVPYGGLVQWQGNNETINEFIESLRTISGPNTIIAISMDKNQKITNEGLFRFERQNVGKRKFEILQFI